MIQTQRFEIKNFKINLINENYLNWFKQKVIKKNIEFKCNNITELKKDVKRRLNNKNSFFFSIHSKSGKHIGNFYLHDINHKEKTSYMGIMIGEKKWRGKNAGYEIISAIINKKLKKNKIRNLFLGVLNDNINAIKLYKKIGFKNYLIKKRSRLMVLDISSF